MTPRQLAHHHDPEPPVCVVCVALFEELAALRLALLNAQTDRDAAQSEAARLPSPRYSAAELARTSGLSIHDAIAVVDAFANAAPTPGTVPL
jgi:hypothetical protein